jgi:dolichol-phosphate mannosyltransferase
MACQDGDRPRRLITVIMPARNEEQNLPRAYDEVTAVMTRLGHDYEVLLIDNDSADGTGRVAAGLCARDARWRYLKFSRNFHVEGSIAAGLRYARGDAAVVLFSDLQDPPELIPEFVRKWQEGCDVVYGVVRDRGDEPAWRTAASQALYRLVHAMSDVEIVPNATDFRLLSRRAIDALNRFDERNRYVRGLAHWIGFRQESIEYDRRPRTAGASKANLLYTLNLAANAITCFSIRPLQLFTVAGFAALAATAALGLAHLGFWLFAASVPGLMTVYVLLLANLAVLLLGFGTVGEYVGRIYVETKRRPLFLIETELNLGDGAADAAPPRGDADDRRRLSA